MIGIAARSVPVWLVMLALTAGSGAWAQSTGLELLMVGNEYRRTDLPENPAGVWWVLHRAAERTLLEELQVVVTPHRTCGDDEAEEQRGRAVSVPAARDPILVVRGKLALRAGTVRTAFLDDGVNGEARRVEVQWDDRAVTVRHVADDPIEDQPGEYRIELSVGGQQFQLHSDQWHGDGHWRVRWIGDLNRDGWPDLLIDASYKYSVYTTRLYLSTESDGSLAIGEAASFTHFAC